MKYEQSILNVFTADTVGAHMDAYAGYPDVQAAIETEADSGQSWLLELGAIVLFETSSEGELAYV